MTIETFKPDTQRLDEMSWGRIVKSKTRFTFDAQQDRATFDDSGNEGETPDISPHPQRVSPAFLSDRFFFKLNVRPV